MSLVEARSRPIAVVPAVTSWPEFPALWGRLLGEVRDCLRAGGIDRPCPLTGRVTASALPAGTAAMTAHRGSFGDVGAAHKAVVSWCAARGYRTGGIRWEIYEPHNEDPGQQWTKVYWLLA